MLDFVLKQLGIELGSAFEPGLVRNQTPDFPWNTEEAPTARQVTDVGDIRSLAEDKKPKTVNEKVALVAYYLRNVAPPDERRDNIVSEDIGRYFVEADFELPSAPPNMTLTNAKNAGYLNSIGPGQYRLNAVGHNLVAHRLPSDGSANKPNGKKKASKKRR